MNEKNTYDNSDELLRAKFDDAIEMPSDFVWDHIEQKLDRPKRKRRWFIWFLVVAILGLFLSIWQLNTNHKNTGITSNQINDNKDFSKNEQKKQTDIADENNKPNRDSNNNYTIATDSEKNNFLNKKGQDINKISAISEKKSLSNTAIEKKSKIKDKNLVKKNIPNIKKNKPTNKGLTTKKAFVKQTKQSKQKNSNYIPKVTKPYIDTTQLHKDVQPTQTIAIATNNDKKRHDTTINIDTLVIDSTKKDSTLTTKLSDTLKNAVTKKTAVIKSKAKEKFLNFYLSPMLSQNSFSTTNSSYDFLNEKGKLSIGIGANYGFSISKKIIVNAGIGYDNIKLVLDNTPLTFNRFITQPFTFNTSLGSIMVDAATMKDGFSSPSPTFPTQYKISYNYTQSLNFITIPLNIGYKIIDNKIRITAFAGIHTQFLIKQKTTLTLIKERNNNIVQFNNFDINQLNTAGNLGLQIQISTKRKLNLYFEPTYKFNFKSLSNEGIIASKTSLLGLHIGVVKNL